METQPDDNLELKRRELDLAEARSQREMQLKEQELLQTKLLKERELEINLQLKQLELQQTAQLKEKELELQRKELSSGRWSGPAAVAVLAGIFTIIGSFITIGLNARTERHKEEGTILLEALRTNLTGKAREQQIAANLVFFADDAGVITLDAKKLEKLRVEAAGVTPALPTEVPAAPTVIPAPVRQRVLGSFETFGKYFESLGLNSAPKVDAQVSDSPGALSYYDPDKHTVYIAGDSLGDQNLPFREYAHAVLYAPAKFRAIDYDRTWQYVGIESGLASYFSSSYRDNPSIPFGSYTKSNDPDQTLENHHQISELKHDASIESTGALAWGAAFWDLRKKLSKDVTDQLLFKSWNDLTENEIKKNSPSDFVERIIASDAALNGGRNRAAIEDVFQHHGLAVAQH
jgi:hypothetical protein